MNTLHAVILGIVEGITEFLPISSTGHLILVSALLGLDSDEQTKRSVDAFNIIIQGGAILAVLGLYRVRVLEMIRGLIGRSSAGLRLIGNLFVAFLPAAVLGVLLDEWIESKLFYPWPVIGALFVGGVLMLFTWRWQRSFFHAETQPTEAADAHTFVDLEHLTWRRALIIGLLQCVAMWPGTSRSMMTIVGGMLVGLRAKHAAEFSFLLGLPTLGGACALKLAKNLSGDEPNILQTLGTVPVVIGMLAAMVSAALAIRWLVAYLNRHGLALFGWYRIGLALVMTLLILNGYLTIARP